MQPRDDSDRQLRQRQLLELLRQLADRIHSIDGVDLDRLLGTARHALAHLDDFTLPDTDAQHRRIVDEARQSSFSFDQTGDDQPWRHPQAE